MSLPSQSQPHQLKQRFKRGIFMQSISHETTARGCKTSQVLVLLGKQHKSLLWCLVCPTGRQITISENFSIHPFQNNKNNFSCLKLCFLLNILEICSCFYFGFVCMGFFLLLLPKQDLLWYTKILILPSAADTQKINTRNDTTLWYKFDYHQLKIFKLSRSRLPF